MNGDAAMAADGTLRFDGPAGFRQRIMLATLADRPICLSGMRSGVSDPGIRDYELSFLQLMEKMTNGSTIKISRTGTKVAYKPGVLIGGEIVHDCGTSRGIGYFLEPILVLASFTKLGVNLTLRGITNNNLDLSVDAIRTVLIPVAAKFSEKLRDIDFVISKRGAYPKGGGEVVFKCPPVDHLVPVDLFDAGRIKRIRGIAYATRASPQIASRMANAARKALTKYIPDVYVFTDTYKGASSGLSPGYALMLVAESTTGSLLSAELSSRPSATNPTEEQILQNLKTPEDLAGAVVEMLLEQISEAGCVDAVSQWLAVSLCAFNIQDASRIKLGKVKEFTIEYLRDLRLFFGLKAKVDICKASDGSKNNVVFIIPGIDYYNKSLAVK